MTTAVLPPAPLADRSRLVPAAAVAIAAAAVAFSALGIGTGNKLGVVVPLVLVAGLGMGALALTHFGAYVVVMLAIRSSIDLGKLSGPSAGSTATNTSATRAIEPSSVLALMFLVLGTWWLIQQRQRHGRQSPSPVRTGLVVLGLAGVVSVVGTTAPAESLVESLRILSIVVMFLVLERLMSDPTMMHRILIAVGLSAAFPLVFTAVGFLIGHPASEAKGSFTRLTGTFTQSNTFGRYLMIMTVFGVAMYPHLTRRARLVVAPGIALATIFLMLTYTRTAIVGAVIGLVIVGIYQSRRVLMALLVAGACALVLAPSVAARFSTVTDTTATKPGAPTGNSLVWRVGYWTQVLPLANATPVTGIGLGVTQYKTAQQKQPHSDFIRAYVETGAAGLGAYLLMLGGLLVTGRRAVLRTARGSPERGVAVGFLGCAVAFIAVSFAANVMSNVVTLWYLVALAAAASVIASPGFRPPVRSAAAGGA